MINITDSIIVLGILFFFVSGWQKGFLKTLSGPISLILGWLGAYVHYVQTQKIIISLILSIVLPFIINFLLSILLNLIINPKEDNKNAPIIGRFAGGCLKVAWSGSLLILTVAAIAMIPGNFPGIKEIQQDILQSHSYKFISKLLPKNLPKNSADIQKSLEALRDPMKLQEMQNTDEYKNFIDDPKIKALYEDEEVLKMIKEKNFVKLLAHPKMQAILQDKDLIPKILSLNQKMMEANKTPAK